MGNKKRSQITIFIILGIAILFAFALLFYAASRNQMSIKQFIGTKDISVENYVQTCLERTTDWALEWAFFQGGIYEKGDVFSTARIPIVTKPSGAGLQGGSLTRVVDFNKEMIRDSIDIFFNDTFNLCINNFDAFKKMGKEVVYQEPKVDVTVEDNTVVMELNLPVKLKENGISQFYDEFLYRKDIKIAEIVDITNKVIDKNVELNLPPSDLLQELLAANKDLTVTITFLHEGWPETALVEYILGFEKSTHKVAFIISYDWYGPGIAKEKIPPIDDIIKQTLSQILPQIQ